MKKQISVLALAALMTVGFAFAAGQDDNVMRKQSDGTKVVKVVAMKNRETPRYFEQVDSKMLPKFAGKRISKVGTVDGVSGATFSSRAVKLNVEAAVKYYKAHK